MRVSPVASKKKRREKMPSRVALLLAGATSAAALACPAGQYGAAPHCVACPAGTFTLPPSLASNSDVSACSAEHKRLNVLLLIADDFKPDIGNNFGDTLSRTPNLNALQKRGVSFVNAHNQAAECTPSRASFLTGLRPDVNGVITIHEQLRGVYPKLITLPQRFKNQGYFVAGVGKVFDGRSAGGARVEDAISWSIPVYNPFPGIYWNPNAGDCGYGDLLLSPQYPAPLVQCSLSPQGDAAYPNYNLTSHAIELLGKIPSPFFLALGLLETIWWTLPLGKCVATMCVTSDVGKLSMRPPCRTNIVESSSAPETPSIQAATPAKMADLACTLAWCCACSFRCFSTK